MKLLLGLSTVFVMSMVSVSALAEPMYGVLMVVKGSVKVQNASKQTTDAKVGGKVMEGDTIITAADSRAKVVMSDRNVINVNPDTQVQITKYENDAASGKKNVEMNLLQGKVRNNVEQTYDGEKSKFLIKTPTAVAGVRGTQFLTGFDIKTRMTSIVTFKGAVTLATLNANGKLGTAVTIKKGQTSSAAPNATPDAPKSVPKDDMKRLEGDTTASMSNKETSKDTAKETTNGEQKRDVASDSGTSKDKPSDGPPPEKPVIEKVPPRIDVTPPPEPPKPPRPPATPAPTPPQSTRTGNTNLKIAPVIPK